MGFLQGSPDYTVLLPFSSDIEQLPPKHGAVTLTLKIQIKNNIFIQQEKYHVRMFSSVQTWNLMGCRYLRQFNSTNIRFEGQCIFYIQTTYWLFAYKNGDLIKIPIWNVTSNIFFLWHIDGLGVNLKNFKSIVISYIAIFRHKNKISECPL